MIVAVTRVDMLERLLKQSLPVSLLVQLFVGRLKSLKTEGKSTQNMDQNTIPHLLQKQNLHLNEIGKLMEIYCSNIKIKCKIG